MRPCAMDHAASANSAGSSSIFGGRPDTAANGKR
jgi:hypothetical protein